MRREYLDRPEMRKYAVDLNNATPQAALAPIRNDEELVREYFMHLFQTEDAYEPYAEYVDDRWLKDVFAETKILAGLGEQEKWYSLLDNPTKYQQLKERVDLRFAPQNKTFFGTDEAVSLAVDVKNVKNADRQSV